VGGTSQHKWTTMRMYKHMQNLQVINVMTTLFSYKPPCWYDDIKWNILNIPIFTGAPLAFKNFFLYPFYELSHFLTSI